MSVFKIAFDTIPWDAGREGVRSKSYSEGGRVLRLVEFDTGEGFNGWCAQGHIGYVLAGALAIDFNGVVHEFKQGDGLFIPAGEACRHRATWIQPGTRLLMLEES